MLPPHMGDVSWDTLQHALSVINEGIAVADPTLPDAPMVRGAVRRVRWSPGRSEMLTCHACCVPAGAQLAGTLRPIPEAHRCLCAPHDRVERLVHKRVCTHARKHARKHARCLYARTHTRRPCCAQVYVNDAFLRLTGYTREECIGRNCRFLQVRAGR